MKSTDDAMIETLSKMSGTMHVTYKDSKTITKDIGAVLKATANESKVSYTVATVERPVVAYNDFAQIPQCNSIVFRAGDFPIWNRNETALPMSWKLFSNTIINPGKEYTLQTIPSLSTAADFDVKQNQPNFTVMFEKRLNQAVASKKAMAYYKDVYGMTDDEIQRLDIDVYSDAIMEIASQIMNPDIDMTVREEKAAPEVLETEPKKIETASKAVKDDTVEKVIQTDERIKRAKDGDKKVYACRTVSRNELVSPAGQVTHMLDAQISRAYTELRNHFAQETKYFRIADDHVTLLSADGKTPYIVAKDNSKLRAQLEEMAKEDRELSEKFGGDVKSTRVHMASAATGEGDVGFRTDMIVTDAFYKLLVSFATDWTWANGEFSRSLANLINVG